MIWLAFLSHCESLPLYKWISSLGCSFHGTNGDWYPVICEVTLLCLWLSPDSISFKPHSWLWALFHSDCPFPSFLVSLLSCQLLSSIQWDSVSILTSKFQCSHCFANPPVNALVLLIFVLPYIGGTTLCHYISVLDRLPNTAMAVAAACFCEVISKSMCL